jgi:dolichol-phosphate mannosyltransferase
MKLLSIVVPVFNEATCISETIHRLKLLKAPLLLRETELELLFVDDGSSDSSLEILRKAAADPMVKVISFSRNFGHQIAITAGTDEAKGDFTAIIDADLQDPPELILDMHQKAIEGYDVVYGRRTSRAGETNFKKYSAAAFYQFINYMSETDIPRDTGDFRLISKRVSDALRGMRERHRFMRGMIPWTGFKSIALEYDRAERFAGETKYPLKKMLQLAFGAILSFSSKPLTIAIRLGVFVTLIGFIGGAYLIYLKFFTSIPIPGVTAVLLAIIISGGVQIMLIGLVGQYIARIFDEVKGRPLYFINEKINF